MSDDLFWQNRIVESGAADPQELAKGMNPLNWRGHPEAQREALEEALDSIGFLQRVLYNKTTNRVIDGHLRIELAVLKGQPLIPVDYVELTEDEEALALATLDAITEQAEPIADKLIALMERTRTMTANKPALAGMLDRLRERAGVVNGGNGGSGDVVPQVDMAAQLQELWGTKVGQVWTVGEHHRLAVGDCTDKAVVEAVMRGEESEILFTSPPYSDQREYNNSVDLSVPYLAQIFERYRSSVNYFVINLGLKHKGDEIDTYWDEWLKYARQAGLKLLSWNVWDKVNATSVKSQMAMFAIQHEWVFVFGDKAKSLNRTWEKSPESEKREKYYRVNERGQKVTTRRQADGGVRESIIGNIYENKQLGTVVTHYAEMARGITSHPAMFPVELPSTHIEAMTSRGNAVVDPFSGSGTTLVACQNLGRKARCIEIDPGYAAVSIQRFFELTRLEPKLISG